MKALFSKIAGIGLVRPLIAALVLSLAFGGWQTIQLERCKRVKAETAQAVAERAVESGERAIQASNEQQARRDDLSRETQEVIDEIRQMEPSLDCDSPAVRRAVERVWGRETD